MKNDIVKNLTAYIRFANDTDTYMFYKGTKELIHRLYTDDYGAPPTVMTLQAYSEEGKRVTIKLINGSDHIIINVDDGPIKPQELPEDPNWTTL